MKIIHLCLGKANPDRMNGVNKVVDALAREQVRQGTDVQVWGITPTPEAQTPPRDYPLSLYHGNGRRFKMPEGLAQAIKALPSEDTIIHFHGVLIPVFYTIARYLKKQGIKWVVTPHGAYNKQSLRHNAWVKWPFIMMCDRFILRHAHGIHVGVISEVETVRWLFGQTPLVAVKNCQNLEDLIFETVEIPVSSRPVFGFIGRLACQHKGLDILIDGFASYIKQGGQGVLWLVGDGPDRKLLEKRVRKHGLQDRVVFYGAQYGQEKFNLMVTFDVFVHTSRWEVNPIAVLEAAGCSTPVLISKPTNLNQEVTQWDAGFVLANNTPVALCKIMLTIDQKLDILPIKGQNAKAMIETEFTWDVAAKTLMEKLYKG